MDSGGEQGKDWGIDDEAAAGLFLRVRWPTAVRGEEGIQRRSRAGKIQGRFLFARVG
jgi:hypothetical protein